MAPTLGGGDEASVGAGDDEEADDEVDEHEAAADQRDEQLEAEAEHVAPQLRRPAGTLRALKRKRALRAPALFHTKQRKMQFDVALMYRFET